VSPLDILASGRYASSAFGYAGKLGRFLAAAMEVAPADRILDAGCNVGVYHKTLAARAGHLVGVDASARAIERARRRHEGLANVEYRVGDLTAMRPEDFEHRFEKILCYSVVHFLGNLDEFEALLGSFVGLLEGGHGMIFLGEVRETELYGRFQEEQKGRKHSRLRDLKFSLLKKIQTWLLRGGTYREGIAPTLFQRREIEDLVARLGGKCERLEQASWHPFYNTCADYRLRF
jgi:2-polyprenyl-3-methyl-5-hydroxy-6-metoxy-1,4-benzoquinol methylase